MTLIKFALKEGADDVVIEKNLIETKQLRFANNKITILNNWNTELYKIFISVKKKIITTLTFEISEESIKEIIKDLIKRAKLLQQNKEYFGIASGPFKYKPIKNNFDKKLINADIVDLANKMISSALENSKYTAGVVYINYLERELETSGNVSAFEKSTSIQASIRAFNKDDESGHSASCSKTLNKINLEEIGKKAGEISKLAKNPEKIKEAKYNVIFDPLAIANLLNLVSRSASAFFIDSGFSFLKNKLNKKVASSIVNLIDSGRIENGFASTAFDDEGVPTKETSIIKNGILKNYLHNTSTAKKYKTKTTANAGLIAPIPTNTILKEGKNKKEDLFKDFNGLYITNVWYTRFQNYLTGDFSTIPRDGIFLVKNGEIIKSVKEIRITDNLQRILENISSISNKPEWVIWWGLETQIPVLTPYVLVREVNITKSTM
ncbi:MAG: TldD/PmbA family protein [Candidatus Aenigmatarchaeota archaeon]